jgi:acetyl esterase/lipase
MSTEAQARVRALLRDIGPRWAQDINAHRAQVVQAYTPLLATHPLPGLQRLNGIAYGDDPRQRLDVYLPPGDTAAPRPIVVFVHGGAFVRGQMNSNEQIYGNVLRFFARHGFVGVNVEYRLAPAAPFPAGAHDVKQALAHVAQHASGWGGDASRMVVIGHSAGGSHVASCLCDPRLQSQRTPVAAAVLVSARLRADLLLSNPNAAGVQAYFGTDPAALAQNAPTAHAQHWGVPSLIAVAEYENPWLDVYAAEFCHQVGLAQGHIPQMVWVPEHNHTSIVAHLDSETDNFFSEQLLAFMSRTVGPAPCPS